MYFSLKQSDIQKVNARPHIIRTSMLTVKYLSEDQYKYSVVVSKKQGNAVERNRVKRVVREMMRKHVNHFPKGYYIIYLTKKCSMVKKPLIEAVFREIMTTIPFNTT